MSMTCVRVGWGTVARIHEKATSRLGVRTVGVVELDPARHESIRAAGLRPFTTCAEAVDLAPTFWDICTPLRSHVDVLQEISGLCPAADVVVEKPVCGFSDIADMRAVLDRHAGRVVVNENYCSSAVTEAVITHVARLRLHPVKVIVEMTKHRGVDFLTGRFLDPELGAFGYEGTHLLAPVAALGIEYLTGANFDLDVDNLPVFDSVSSPLDNCEHDLNKNDVLVWLNHQGGAFVGYRTGSGCRVELYTSLSGVIGYPCPPHAPKEPRIPQADTESRYRIFRVDGVDPAGAMHQVVGFYEPLRGFSRGLGAVALFRDWELAERISTLPDDTMTRHFRRIIAHFTGSGDNPCPPELALTSVSTLHAWAKTGFAETGHDPEHILGRLDLEVERKLESRRFRIPGMPV